MPCSPGSNAYVRGCLDSRSKEAPGVDRDGRGRRQNGLAGANEYELAPRGQIASHGFLCANLKILLAGKTLGQGSYKLSARGNL